VNPIVHVHMLITTACNLQCPDCCQQMPRKWPGEHESWASLERAARYLQGYPLCVCGGEPTAHPDFARIAREFRELFRAPYMEVATNGYQVVEHGTDVMRCFDLIRVTDYPNAITQAAIAWCRQEVPDLLRVEGFRHIALKFHGNEHPCGREYFPIYSQGRVFPCCVATGFPDAESTALSSGWETRLPNLKLPCVDCVFGQ